MELHDDSTWGLWVSLLLLCDRVNTNTGLSVCGVFRTEKCTGALKTGVGYRCWG